MRGDEKWEKEGRMERDWRDVEAGGWGDGVKFEYRYKENGE